MGKAHIFYNKYMNKMMMSVAALALPCAAFAGAYGDMFKNGHLRFDYTPKEIAALEAQAAQELEVNLNFLAKIPAQDRDFNNTILALESAYTAYWFVPKNLSLLAYFHADPDVRKAAARLEAKGSQTKAAVFAKPAPGARGRPPPFQVAGALRTRRNGAVGQRSRRICPFKYRTAE